MASNIEYNFDSSVMEEAIRKEVGLVSNNNDSDDNDDNNKSGRNLSLDTIEEYKSAVEKQLEEETGEKIDKISDDKNDDNRDTPAIVDTPSGDSDDNDSDNDLLEVLRQEQLLYIPEDFEGELDADTIDYFKQQTIMMRDQQILNSKRQQFAQDPHKLRLFDYFFFAGPDADLPTFTEASENYDMWENFDVSDENNQKEIIQAYLIDGLNPESPNYDMFVKDIPNKVEEIISNYEGEERAKKAVVYFQQKEKITLENEINRVNEIKRREEEYEMQLQQAEQQWNMDFQSQIANKQWSPSKKQSILQEQYREVDLEGEYVPVWYAKEQIIKSNPELYVQYLDWLNSSFDLQSGQFKKTNDQSESDERSKVTRKIMDLINKKKDDSRKSQYVETTTTNEDENILVNPLDNL